MSNYRSTLTDITDLLASDDFKKIFDFFGKHGKKTLEWVQNNGHKSLIWLDKHGNKVEFIDNYGDHIASAIDNSTEYLKKNTIKWEVFDEIELLDVETLKEIVAKTMTEQSIYTAVLNLGMNTKSDLEIFIQHLDADKKAIESNRFYLIRCVGLAKDLKQAFAEKELLLLTL